VVGPKEKREAVELLNEKFKVSLKRACDVLGLNRSTFDYRKKTSKDEAVKTRMLELTDRFRRFGRPRIHALLNREGLVQNEKRTRRIYCELKLQLKHRRGKRRIT
jgi:putative transposase